MPFKIKVDGTEMLRDGQKIWRDQEYINYVEAPFVAGAPDQHVHSFKPRQLLSLKEQGRLEVIYA